MDSVLNFSAITLPIASPHRYQRHHFRKASAFSVTGRKCNAVSPNGCASAAGGLSSAGDAHNQRSSLESLFCYDKSIPEEVIEKPVGLSLADREIGDKPRCSSCEAKGAVLCLTCTGSGLYVDSILESQGIIVKVRCLGCGGTGNIMCSECGVEVMYDTNFSLVSSEQAFTGSSKYSPCMWFTDCGELLIAV